MVHAHRSSSSVHTCTLKGRDRTHHDAKNAICRRGQPIPRPSIFGGEQLWGDGIEDSVHHLSNAKD